MSSAGVVALRGTSQQDGRRFICPARTWDFLRELGQTFGWQPRGTTYVTSARPKKSPPPIRHDYQPGSAQDYKQIEADDAIEWARALSTAKHSGYFSAMAGAHAGLVDTPEKKALLNVVDEFIDFAREGAFVFAVAAEIPQQQSERDSHA
jgi:hypothetical protein